VHLILAHRALDLFFPPGDYSGNVSSDAADYVAFRKGLGTTYVPFDYDIWRAHFGQISAGGSASGVNGLAISGAPTPEPSSAILLAWIFLALTRRSVFRG
jgi:hypothetical protein